MKTIAIATVLAGQAAAFFRMSCPSRLLIERADPIVNPGEISSHSHTISGGSGFALATDYQRMRDSACTSCAIKEDLSAYWTPNLYYHARNGSFISVPQAGDGNGNMGGHTVYYLQRPGPNNDKLHAFPENFRMLAGDPMKRSFTGGFDAQAISYVCLDYKNGAPVPEGNAFPSVNCPDGVRMQVFFPSCWDGVNLDSDDHKSHMAYPESGAYNTGTCPASHPVHMISLFYEVIYQTNLFANDWYGDGQPFVLSTGDPTGYGFHGDFVNGWDVKVLQNAVDNCNADSGLLSDCDAFSLLPDTISQACKLPTTIDELVLGELEQLPGCNPIQVGPSMAVKMTTGCSAPSAIGPQEVHYTNVNAQGWQYVGCGSDSTSSRTLTGASSSGASMTVQNCINFCSGKGFTYAGIEYANQCYCGNSLPVDRAPIDGILGNCNMPCAGDSTEVCGGSSALSIYQKCSGACQDYTFSGITNGTVIPSIAVPNKGSASGQSNKAPAAVSSKSTVTVKTVKPTTKFAAAVATPVADTVAVENTDNVEDVAAGGVMYVTVTRTVTGPAPSATVYQS